MNKEIRKYLIDQCRIGKPVFYEDIGKKLNLNLESEKDRNILSKTLGDISAFEHEKERPLISSIAIYKIANDHGNGFYNLCEQLGIGKSTKLKEEFYGFTQLELSKKFWNTEYNYQQFYNIDVPIYFENEKPFFNNNEIDFFRTWANKIYDKDNFDDYNAKEFLLNSVWLKTKFWSEEVIKRLNGWECSNKTMWSKRGWEDGERVSTFKPYTWARIYKKGKDSNEIFFTIGIDAKSKAIIYKLDYYHENNSILTSEQKELCKKHIPKNLRWNEISNTDILNWNWEKLISFTVDFISTNSHHYDKLVEIVWGNDTPTFFFTDHLTKREQPNGGFKELPKLNPKFIGNDTDFIRKNTEDKSLGDAGEELVKNYEMSILKQKGLTELSKQVSIRKDGEGYDILSFNENGKEKFIEVKTTKGNEKTPFHLSINEKIFSEQNIENYVIYRLYNYDDEKNTADFYEICNLEDELLFQPTEFKVYLKNKN